MAVALKAPSVEVVGVERRAVGRALSMITVPFLAPFYTDITVLNNMGAPQIKDFMAVMGEYDPVNDEFIWAWPIWLSNITIPEGESTTPVLCPALQIGDWDALGAIGHKEDDVFTIESSMVLTDALTVVGWLMVTGVGLRTP